MRKIFFALLVCMTIATSVYGAVYRIVSSDARSVTVEFTIPEPSVVPLEDEGQEGLNRVFVSGFQSLDLEGAPILPVRRFFFAVPGKEGVRLDLLEQDSYFLKGVLPGVTLEKGSYADERKALAKAPALGEQTFVRLSGVETLRGRDCAFVDIHPVLFDPEGKGLACARRLVVRLSFPAAETGDASKKRSLLSDDLIINGEQAASWKRRPERIARAERTPFEFALSSTWVKIRIKGKGIYIITYNDLLSAGADPGSIDPATMRLFSTAPYHEPDSLGHGGSWLEDYHLTEHAILHPENGAGSFQPGDTVFFYGIGVNGWANDVEPNGAPRGYIEHPYDSANVYWLTWGGSFSGAPREMARRSVAPGGAVDTAITWYEERIHVESDLLYDPIYTDDRWYWQLLRQNDNASFTNDFFTHDVAEQAGVLKTMAYGPYNYKSYQNAAAYRINGVNAGTLDWAVWYGYNPAAMKTLEVPFTNLLEGKNVFRITKAVDDEMYVFWYEIFYRRLLKARLGAFDFHVPERPLRASYALTGFPSGEKFLFDVTFHESPVLCTGWQPSPGGLAFEDSLASRPRHYEAVSRSALKNIGTLGAGALELVAVPSLRDESGCPHMLIIYHRNFRNAALMLKGHHEKGIPGIDDPVVKAVDIADIYDNFSGGRKDPVAIRNYLKFLYDRGSCLNDGEPLLAYVLLIGNGTNDPRDVQAQHNDFMPFFINNRYPNESEGVEDEDYFVKLDGGIDRAPDLAIGRMSVLTGGEANAWAERIVDYEENPEYGAWRNKVILVADDEYSTVRQDDFEFLISTEELASRRGPFPSAVDFKKIYLHIYPFLGDGKPAARKDLLKEWSDGALIVNYNGHGSPLQMADERVMVNTDIYSLTNGMRRPLMLSFSCSVGDLESPFHRSMAQNMVTFDEGGAIGTISAAAPTYLYPNKLLNEMIFQSLFTSKDSTGTRPVGYALQLAKYSTMAQEYESNNVKYILLGDPAMRLGMPSYKVEHETSTIDTMYTGQRCRVDGAVKVGGQVLESFTGIADVTVQEAEQKVREVIMAGGAPIVLNYTLPGKELFRGTVDVTAGRFSAEYVVPRRCRTGPRARIRSYVTSSLVDGVGACDTLHLLPADTLRADLEPPVVSLYFAGQATRVKSGAKLIADIADPDGIAILGTDPQSSIFLEFDGSGYPIYVTEYFAYDHGSYTAGKVEYPLHTGFSPGEHTVLIKVFDNLGLASSATLRFEIVEEGLYAVSEVFNFPNPFSRSTNFVFQVTSPAEALLSIFSLSGVKVWESRIAADEGFNSINWDGRDVAGDMIANGTYLYILEVNFRDSFHRKETVKGKAVYLR